MPTKNDFLLDEKELKRLAGEAAKEIEQILHLFGKSMAGMSKQEIQLYLEVYVAGATNAIRALEHYKKGGE